MVMSRLTFFLLFWTMWWSQLVEGLLSIGPTPSSLNRRCSLIDPLSATFTSLPTPNFIYTYLGFEPLWQFQNNFVRKKYQGVGILSKSKKKDVCTIILQTKTCYKIITKKCCFVFVSGYHHNPPFWFSLVSLNIHTFHYEIKVSL